MVCLYSIVRETVRYLNNKAASMALYHTFPLIARIFFSNRPSAVYSFPP